MSYITTYFDGVKALMDQIPSEQIEQLANLLEAAWKNNARVLLMANGGSSATTSHIVNDFQKCFDLECGKPLKTICLSDCTPLILAWGNDTEFANIYAPQVRCWAEPGDLVIGVSGSGNSPNIVNGLLAAKEKGAFAFGMAGYSGGKLVGASDTCIVVPTNNMQQIEDLHMIIFHVVFSMIRDRNRL